MPINAKQFAYLTEMDIPLWQRKSLVDTDSQSSTSENEQKSMLNVSFESFSESQIFVDTLTSLSLSIDDVSWKDDHLDLGLFNWYFHDSDTIHYQQGNLKTPIFDHIKQSHFLKKQLWSTFNTHQLNN